MRNNILCIRETTFLDNRMHEPVLLEDMRGRQSAYDLTLSSFMVEDDSGCGLRPVAWMEVEGERCIRDTF